MPKSKYTPEALQAAINDVKKGVLSKKAAAKKYGIPRATIQFRLSEKFSKVERGPPPILTKEEEDLLEEWIINCCKKGFPRRKEDIQLSVQEFLIQNNRPNPFKDDLPGIGWYQAFLRRHPKITQRTPEAVTAASSCVSESDIKNWFVNIESVLREENVFDVLKNPDRIFNGDETNFLLCPKNSKVLAPIGYKNVYEVDKGKAKSAITAMFTFSASGKVVPPMLIFPYQRLPSTIVNSVPDKWGIGHSDNGWMKAELFYEYIGNVFNTYLIENNVPLPVILFVDGHKSHLSYQLSVLCSQLQIILVALYPNATRILQPADVAAFRPIKSGWKQAIMKWRKEHPTEAVTRECVAPLLKKVVDEIKPDVLCSGFKACGLYPWKSESIDFSKCLGKSSEKKTDSTKPNASITLERFEDIVGDEMLNKFQNIESVITSGTEQPLFYTLFRVWDEFQRNSVVEKACEDKNQANDVTEITSESDVLSVSFKDKGTPHLEVSQDNGTASDSLTIPPAHMKNDHTYSTPTKPSTSSEPLMTTSRATLTPASAIDSTGTHSSHSSLAEVLYWPESPKRKGKRETERVPFVVTSKKWKLLFEEKKNKKDEEEKKKAERKRKREENKVIKEKNMLEKKKRMNRKKCVLVNHKGQQSKSINDSALGKKGQIQLPHSKLGETKDVHSPAIAYAKKEHDKSEKNKPNQIKGSVENRPNQIKGRPCVENTYRPSLCYSCGLNIKAESIECDLCDKVYHKTCLPNNFQIDEMDPVFVCAPCIQFNNEIINDGDLKVYEL